MMSRYLRVVVIAASLFGLAGHVSAATAPEAVTNFAQTATLDRSGTLTVDDEIDYDFGATPPYAVPYKIPLSYHDDQGTEYRMNFALISSDLDGKAASFSPEISAATGIFKLPAGSSPNTTRHYSLRYRLGPVLLIGDSADTLKLAITGLGWSVPLEHISLTFNTPVAPADNLTCYTGEQGSTSGACTVTQNDKTATVVSTATLPADQGLSIFADFPHNSVQTYLRAYDPQTPTISGLLLRVGAVLLLFIILVAWLTVWRRRRRIVHARPSDYTNANEAPKGQAHRK